MINIPLYYMDDEDDEDFDIDDWGSIRFFIQLDPNVNSDIVIVYTYDDGTFEVVNKVESQISYLKKYKKEVPMDMWRDFLKSIFNNEEEVRRYYK